MAYVPDYSDPDAHGRCSQCDALHTGVRVRDGFGRCPACWQKLNREFSADPVHPPFKGGKRIEQHREMFASMLRWAIMDVLATEVHGFSSVDAMVHELPNYSGSHLYGGESLDGWIQW